MLQAFAVFLLFPSKSLSWLFWLDLQSQIISIALDLFIWRQVLTAIHDLICRDLWNPIIAILDTDSLKIKMIAKV